MAYYTVQCDTLIDIHLYAVKNGRKYIEHFQDRWSTAFNRIITQLPYTSTMPHHEVGLRRTLIVSHDIMAEY